MNNNDNIHTCSYSCERPACIKAQRDELAQRLLELVAEAVAAEREACLDLVNRGTGEATSADVLKILHMERDRISAAIRARGQ